METVEWAEQFVASGSEVDVEISYYERPLYRIHTSAPRQKCSGYLATYSVANLWWASKAQVVGKDGEIINWYGRPLEYWAALRESMLLAIEGLREAWTNS